MKLKAILFSLILLSSLSLFSACHSDKKGSATDTTKKAATTKAATPSEAATQPADTATAKVVYPPLDKPLYDSLMKRLAHGDSSGRWPVKNTPYPLPGAILPFKRVVAFY